MSDDEDETICPLCVEEMDMTDKNFLPCPCGYRVCMWCWHHIRENLNGLCPACRTPYNADPHAFSAVDRSEIVKKNRERKQKEKQEKKVTDKPAIVNAKPVIQTIADRRHLHNYRVIQRNLVYVIGVPAAAAGDELLRRPEYFGQYGKIGKMVIHRNNSAPQASVSAYVTFVYKDDAKAAIQALDGFWYDGHLLRASFGTTKYCNNFIRGVACNNPDCVYLHDLGDDDDRFTKEEIQAGHSKLPPTPGTNQTIVTGNGGPSGTGKKPVGEPLFPAPIFIQDVTPPPSSAGASGKAKEPSGVVRTSSWPSLAAREGEQQAAATSSTIVPNGASPNSNLVGLSADTDSIQSEIATTPGAPVLRASSDRSLPSTSTTGATGANTTTVLSTRNAKVAARKQALEAAQASKAAMQAPKAGGDAVGNTPSLAGIVSSTPMASDKTDTSTVVPGIVNIVPSAPGPASTPAPIPAVTESLKPPLLPSLGNDTTGTSGHGQTASETPVVGEGSPRGSTSEASPSDPSNLSISLPATIPSISNQKAGSLTFPTLPTVSTPSSSSLAVGAPGANAVAFNGLGKCAVFPVPQSSLVLGVWASILAVSSSDLSVNPYGRLALPLSELLDLTLPPVDALCMAPWPKPAAYYRQGCAPDGSSHSYVGRPIARTNSWSLDQHQQQHLPLSQSYSPSTPSSSSSNANVVSGMNVNAAPQGSGPSAPNNQQSIAMLQQMFPSVKMSYGVPGQTSRP